MDTFNNYLELSVNRCDKCHWHHQSRMRSFEYRLCLNVDPLNTINSSQTSRTSTSDSNVSISGRPKIKDTVQFFYLTLTDDHNKLHGSKELTSFSPSKGIYFLHVDRIRYRTI